MTQQQKCAEYIRMQGIENVRVIGQSVSIFSPMGHDFYLDENEVEYRAHCFDEEIYSDQDE